jgi:translation elongation factor EF-Tu-like GTPase
VFRLTVQDVFVIRNRGVVVTGRVENGALRVGDTVQINGALSVRVDAIEKFRKELDEAVAGENIGVLLKGIEKGQINPGDVITSSGEAPPIESTNVIV